VPPGGSRSSHRRACSWRRCRNSRRGLRPQPSSRALRAVGRPWAMPRRIGRIRAGRRCVPGKEVPVQALQARPHPRTGSPGPARGGEGGGRGVAAAGSRGRPARRGGVTRRAYGNRRPRPWSRSGRKPWPGPPCDARHLPRAERPRIRSSSDSAQNWPHEPTLKNRPHAPADCSTRPHPSGLIEQQRDDSSTKSVMHPRQPSVARESCLWNAALRPSQVSEWPSGPGTGTCCPPLRRPDERGGDPSNSRLQTVDSEVVAGDEQDAPTRSLLAETSTESFAGRNGGSDRRPAAGAARPLQDRLDIPRQGRHRPFEYEPAYPLNRLNRSPGRSLPLLA
jgi:hypothetical protein